MSLLRWGVVGIALLAVGCSDPTGSPDGVRPRTSTSRDDGGVACARPAEGCACADGEGPLDCYLDPTESEQGTVCHAGTRHCRDGAWTGCESIRTYVLDQRTALIGGPDECNACDPACLVARDTPTATDLSPANSSRVEYNPTAGGVVITANGTGIANLPDADSDGVPDQWDNFPTDPTRDGFRENGGIFHAIPFGRTAGPSPFSFSTQIRTADLYFLIDRTASMDGEIANLRRDLTTGSFRTGCSGGIIGAAQCIIPDAWIGVGWFGEYAVAPYGDSNDVAYRNVLDIGNDVSLAQNAVNGITTNGNVTWEEAAMNALYATVTGSGLGRYVNARTGCRAGTWGYPCFREETVPIVVLITDAPYHNGPNTTYDYDRRYFSQLPSSSASARNNDQLNRAYNFGIVNNAWVSATGTTRNFANDYDFDCNENAEDAVFRFQLTSRQVTTITLEGSSYDTVLGVFPTNDPNLDNGFCNDDADGLGNVSRLVLDLPAGTYYAIVDGYDGADGNYRISVGNPCSVANNCFSPPTWNDTVNALRARNVRVLGIESSEGYVDCRANADALAAATSSVDSNGAPFVFSINDDGTGLSDAVVNAIEDLANYSRMDITARANDNPATAVDERAFVDTVTASTFPAGRCNGIAADNRTFLQCLPGTQVGFRITFRNNVVPAIATPQVFDFTIEVVGDGTYSLSTVPVRIVVPPITSLYPSSGTYWRDYDSTMHCVGTERPDWGDLAWRATIPLGTSIRFEIRTAERAADLASATPVTFTTPTAVSPRDVGVLLAAAGRPNFLPHMRVSAVLLANTALTTSPVLQEMSLRFTCTPIE